jgi:hypothetical protein
MSAPEAAAAGVAQRCRTEGGLIKATLGELREELGYRKLGRWVLAEIAETLESAGVGFFPRDLLNADLNTEPRQWQMVWIYDRDGGPRARVVDAILDPDKHDVPAVLDGLVAGDASALSPEQKLIRIRDLVCD